MLRFINHFYGDFTRQELKKYLFLGGIFALTIGLIWSLMPLRDTVFCNLVIGFANCYGRELREMYIAWAKLVSLGLMIPAVMGYDLLLSKIKKRNALMVLGGIYAGLLLLFAGYFKFAHGIVINNPTPWMISAWLWYTLIDSLTMLFISAFWAFVLDISDEKSAQKGFGLIIMISQLGGMTMPILFNKLPHLISIQVPGMALVASIVMVLIAVMVHYFLMHTPPQLLAGYHASHDGSHAVSKGSWYGLRLILSSRYLMILLGMGICFDFMVNLLDFNFKTMTFAAYDTLVDAGIYLSRYASLVNMTTFFLLLFGISGISRRFGLRASFSLVFAALLIAIGTFALSPSISTVMWMLLVSKAIQYSLNSPSMKQLYVPTSKEVKYHGQTWIETIGSSGAKTASAMAGSTKTYLGFALYVSVTSYVCAGLLGLWLVLALMAVRMHDKAVKNDTFIA